MLYCIGKRERENAKKSEQDKQLVEDRLDIYDSLIDEDSEVQERVARGKMDKSDIILLNASVNRWVEAFNSHNVSSIVALYAEGAELFDSGMKRPRYGRDEIERWFSKRFRDMPSIMYTPTGQIVAEEHVAVLWTVHGRSPRILGQGWLSRPFQVDGVSIFTIHDGFIQKQRGYYEHLAALEQILPPLKWLLPPRL